MSSSQHLQILMLYKATLWKPMMKAFLKILGLKCCTTPPMSPYDLYITKSMFTIKFGRP